MKNCWMCECDTAEYVDTGLATDRGDIYSFGVMILELVTGRRPCDEFFQDSGMSLPQWVRIPQSTSIPQENRRLMCLS